jgi:hypothetical protein
VLAQRRGPARRRRTLLRRARLGRQRLRRHLRHPSRGRPLPPLHRRRRARPARRTRSCSSRPTTRPTRRPQCLCPRMFPSRGTTRAYAPGHQTVRLRRCRSSSSHPLSRPRGGSPSRLTCAPHPPRPRVRLRAPPSRPALRLARPRRGRPCLLASVLRMAQAVKHHTNLCRSPAPSPVRTCVTRIRLRPGP